MSATATIWYLDFHQGHQAWVIGTNRTIGGRRVAWRELIPGSPFVPPSGVELMPYLAIAEAAMARAEKRIAQEGS